MTQQQPSPAVFSLRRNVAAGLLIASAFAMLVGAATATIEISGAAIASGMLVVDGNVKNIQHPTGGIVAALLVRNGDRVRAGDVLVRLDDAQARANLAIVSAQLDELEARRDREEAEQNSSSSIDFSSRLTSRSDDPVVARLMDGERKLFASRREARENQKTQLREEIDGIEVQRNSRVSQIEWIGKELAGIRDLWEQKLVPYTRLTALERESARLEGERGQLISSVAQARSKIVQIDQDMRSETGRDLAEIRGKIAELSERKVAAEDQMRRIEIRSPLDGVVHQSEVHTVGGVIAPGETIMLIVPRNDDLTAEIRIPPQEIDQVRIGQKSWIRFSSFNQRTTPELNGTVALVSADITQDAKTGASYYIARIAVPESEMKKLDDLRLVAGMPVEAFVQTSERSIISYLARPLTDQILRSFREK